MKQNDKICYGTSVSGKTAAASTPLALSQLVNHRLGPAVVREYPRASVLYGQEEHCTSVYQVLSGAVKTYRTGLDGSEHVTRFALGNDVIGLLDHSRHLETAETTCQTTLRIWPRARLDALLAQDPRVAGDLWRATRAALDHAYRQLAIIGRKPTMERVAWFLLDLAARYRGQNRHPTLRIAMTRRDIADYLGLSTETVCRCLTRLRARRVIDTPKWDLVVLRDPAALEALCLTEPAETADDPDDDTMRLARAARV
ncbi:hypothetical protein CCR80_13950 [Rhodothalassium salexigens]|nr:helix-turn-helix domain-containing protein [Rhodothalassium salexigens]MBK5922139.1 hypothetical protein [Rhodothalassium salexigens]